MILIQLGNNLEKPFITKIWILALTIMKSHEKVKESAHKKALRVLKTVMELSIKSKLVAGETGL
jgi:hypothetical protein